MCKRTYNLMVKTYAIQLNNMGRQDPTENEYDRVKGD